MSIKDFLFSLLADERGSVSHKRVIAIIGAFVLFSVFIASKDAHMADLVFYMTLTFAGLTTVDKFTK